MNVTNMTSSVEIECTISTGPGIQCSASEHGFITIQTNAESITIRLQQTINKKRVPITSVSQQPVQPLESSSRSGTTPAVFWFAGNSDQEDTQLDTCSHGRQADTDASNTRGFKNGTSGPKKLGKRISDEELARICQQLASKTLKKWKSKQHKIEKSLEAMRSDWPNFFGYPSYSSMGQWSYKALDTSETFGGLQRPFYQLSLAHWWSECLKQRTSEVTSRIKTMMISALEPRFEKLESKEKDAKRRQIDRYVLQGEVISLMLAHTPGLVVTVSDLITTPEYAPQSSLVPYH
jgi:hypothetical protein